MWRRFWNIYCIRGGLLGLLLCGITFGLVELCSLSLDPNAGMGGLACLIPAIPILFLVQLFSNPMMHMWEFIFIPFIIFGLLGALIQHFKQKSTQFQLFCEVLFGFALIIYLVAQFLSATGCFAIDDDLERSRCHLADAVASGDSEICRYTYNDVQCIIAVAAATGDLSLCNEKINQAYCYGFVAAGQGEPELCEHFEGGDRDYCYHILAQKTLNATFCSHIVQDGGENCKKHILDIQQYAAKKIEG